MERRILHVDMDAFFASVEILDNPKLKGKPIIVGGESGRGVVTTCSYEARKYGVKSAMPGFKAKALCPNGIFVPIRYYRYREVSNKVFNLLYDITEKIEQVSIDEAYLDISDLDESSMDVAMRIKNLIKNNIGLTLSVGISYNKFLAKIASDWKKPNGLMEIKKENVKTLLGPLEISKVYGLGQKSVKKLNNIGVYTINDMYRLPKDIYSEYFGKFGNEIYDRIRGIDNREIINKRERKSIGKEITLKEDTKNIEELRQYLMNFSEYIEAYLKKHELKAKTITLKIKDRDFINHSKSKTLNYYLKNKDNIYSEAIKLLNEIIIEKKLRLIGISVSSLEQLDNEQLSLFNI
ncbi:DNA polymerase IV [Clostridium massiliamazoniense]|uniref:DNA polymerase IV n=1 Tax=Clostridium massiliamazoniense TaxID=1347366 RepID=UPI0006D7C5A1|nr:DNA polymerase IV [Clostridium massiliamazoniense]